MHVFADGSLEELCGMQLPKLMEFEKEAEKLLQGGGIKNKTVKVIQSVSKVIRDKIDTKLEVLNDEKRFSVELFIS